MLITVLLLVAAAITGALTWIARDLRAARRAATLQSLLATFGRAVADVERDPRTLLVWHPMAAGARRLFPDAFAELDAATNGSFPFTRDQIQAAHARWTTDWLSWERAHAFEYKLKAAAAEEELDRHRDSEAARVRLHGIEREKLERYQQKYEEYVRVSKALAALAEGPIR